MLYNFLINLITKVGKSKLSVWKSEFKVNGLPFENILLKVIIWESYMDTNTNKQSTRTKLSSLYDYISTIGCNNTKFNVHVKLFPAGLSEGGETSNDLLTKLFNGYKAALYSFFSSTLTKSKKHMRMGRTWLQYPSWFWQTTRLKFKVKRVMEYTFP